MSDILIKAKNVSKKFCRGQKKSMFYGLKDISQNMLGLLPKTERLRVDEFWAVDDVSFELRRGECLGLIGNNGSGKSTLLKILNGIISPDKGRIEINGKIGALIEVGAGFHPMLTGRENIYLYGSILGFSKKEIHRKFDKIVTFSEIEDFLDSPIRRYSSGMRVRLGFAIAAQLEPDVLLLDEVLAVGDIGFRAKSFNAISEIAKNAAIIFVSHQIPQIARISSAVGVLNKGKMVQFKNDIASGIEYYYGLCETNIKPSYVGSKATLNKLTLYSNDNKKHENIPRIQYRDDIIIELRFSVKKEIKRFVISIAFFNQSQNIVAQCISRIKGKQFINIGKEHHVSVCIPEIAFAPGKYSLTLMFTEIPEDDSLGVILARYDAIKEFSVSGSIQCFFANAPILLNGEWAI